MNNYRKVIDLKCAVNGYWVFYKHLRMGQKNNHNVISVSNTTIASLFLLFYF